MGRQRWRALLAGCLALLAGAASAEPAPRSCPPQATAPTRELMARAREQATDRGFLWRLSRDGRDSFLYGTVHAGRPEWFALGPQVQTALHRTGALALEINVADPAVQARLQAVLDGPPRPLPPALMQALREAWHGECLPEADLARGPAELALRTDGGGPIGLTIAVERAGGDVRGGGEAEAVHELGVDFRPMDEVDELLGHLGVDLRVLVRVDGDHAVGVKQQLVAFHQDLQGESGLGLLNRRGARR